MCAVSKLGPEVASVGTDTQEGRVSAELLDNGVGKVGGHPFHELQHDRGHVGVGKERKCLGEHFRRPARRSTELLLLNRVPNRDKQCSM